jgi:hypothetical protein
MERKRLLTLVVASLLTLTCYSYAGLSTGVWDVSADYSGASNPNGQWSYGRKWSPSGTGFDLFWSQWGSYGGWNMGNTGHGGPAIQAAANLWAKDNSNGLPAVRWTCPESGPYSLDFTFQGVDSRGVDANVFVAVDGSLRFSDHIGAYLGTASYSPGTVVLEQGDLLDFVVQWNGGVYSEYSWTYLTGTIKAVPEPASLSLLAFGALAILRRRRYA